LASPPWKTSQLESPTATGDSVSRTYRGFAAALATLKIPELLALSAHQAALLEAERQRVLSEMLLASGRSSLDQPVVQSTPTELPYLSGRDHDARLSQSPQPQPSSLELLSSAGRLGPRLAGALIRASRSTRRR
jgi:hypothetical protein